MRSNVIVAIIVTINAFAMILMWIMGVDSVPMGAAVFYVIYIASQSWLIVIVCKERQEIIASLDARVRSEEFEMSNITYDEIRKYRMNGSTKE